MRNSTIILKKKQLDCGHYDYNFSKGNCKQCSIIKSTNKRVSKLEEQEEDESVKNLVEDLDAIFSLYIRLKYADSKGTVKCYTCHKQIHYTQIQNGHFESRYNYSTRWLEDNCRPQCVQCNSRHEEHPEIFSKELEKERDGIVEYIKEQSKQVYKPTRDELKQMIANYRFQVKLLKSKLNK